MSESIVFYTMARENKWSLAHTNRDDSYARYETWVHRDHGVLVVGFAVSDNHISHVTWFSKRVPSGETLGAGDRFRYVLKALAGER